MEQYRWSCRWGQSVNAYWPLTKKLENHHCFTIARICWNTRPETIAVWPRAADGSK
jgi:hypothetical protein